jgi:hypothetical protein|tara:strand:+ start:213 stop:374 length:162 start_codon:yes stop_codon:yes gene_type:complete
MALLRKVFRFLIRKNFFKDVLIYALKELAKMTDNGLDDQFVRVIEARLYPKGK